MLPPGVKPAATRKSITDQLLAGNIPRAQARAAIESGVIDGAIAALEAFPEIFQGTITDRIDDTYEVTLDNDEVWPCVGDDQISLL